MHLSYDWTPDAGKLIKVFAFIHAQRKFRSEIVRKFRDGKRKTGAVNIERLTQEMPQLEQVDLDFYWRPGNPEIRQYGYIDLKFKDGSAHCYTHGNHECFKSIYNICIEALGLIKSPQQLLNEKNESWSIMLDPFLWGHISGALHQGRFASALSSAVVYVEDRLRSKIAPAGQGLTGADLAQVAYKSPGILIPPLSIANNSSDNAFLMIRGWIGLVRNLHGHHSSISMTLDEVNAQLSGLNYMLWVIQNSSVRPLE